MTTESMKALAKKRAGKDFEGKYPDMPKPQNNGEPSAGRIPNPVDRSYARHSTADAVKGRNERAMGKGTVDVTIGEPELRSSDADDSEVVMYAPNEIKLRKSDRKEGDYPDMPEPKDNSEHQDKKFSMVKALLGHMDRMDK